MKTALHKLMMLSLTAFTVSTLHAAELTRQADSDPWHHTDWFDEIDDEERNTCPPGARGPRGPAGPRGPRGPAGIPSTLVRSALFNTGTFDAADATDTDIPFGAPVDAVRVGTAITQISTLAFTVVGPGTYLVTVNLAGVDLGEATANVSIQLGGTDVPGTTTALTDPDGAFIQALVPVTLPTGTITVALDVIDSDDISIDTTSIVITQVSNQAGS